MPTADTLIRSVLAVPLNVPVIIDLAGARQRSHLSCCLVCIETAGGLIGYGFTAITEEEVVATIIREVVAPSLIGQDALAHEAIWERLYWLLAPRGQSGYASHAIAAIDVALWDLKGKSLGLPICRLVAPCIAGARSGHFDL